MRHFFRTHLAPQRVMDLADVFFADLKLRMTASAPRARTWQGIVGTPEVVSTVRLQVRAEGGHWAFVEVTTDQMGESRMDRNVKRFFVSLHKEHEPHHVLEAAY